MNKAQQQLTKAQLKEEERALKELKKAYEKAKIDCQGRISALNARTDLQNISSIVYQKKYQEVLLNQIDRVLDDLNKNQYHTLKDFFEESYRNGYTGSMFDINTQGIPLTLPISDEKMINAITTNSMLSSKYHQDKELPENLTVLRRNIRIELTRGIASGKTWLEVAYQLANKMNSPFDRAMNDAMRIVRTEGHRINQRGFLDASEEAVKRGADIVKQWDATLDGNTRPWHKEADGQIREMNEQFSVGGEKMDAPAIGGSARNVCNCRCQLLQRARWALDEEELDTLKKRAEFFGLNKEDDFEEFKKKFNLIEKYDSRYNTIRELPEIKYNVEAHGIKELNSDYDLEESYVNRFGATVYDLTVNKRDKTEWEDLPKAIKLIFKYTKFENKAHFLNKDVYNIQQYVPNTPEYNEMVDIGEFLNMEWLGSSFKNKNSTMFEYHFFRDKNGKIHYSVGKPDIDKKLKAESLEAIEKVIKEREEIILDDLRKKNIRIKTVTQRNGDDWVKAMKELHKTLQADGLPTIISDSEYDSNKNPILYRGIAPTSSLRQDITTTLTVKEMANEFFQGLSPFPSRGVYGDGIAYCSPAMKKIALNYATNGGRIPHGGAIIEFKLKQDAKVIEYEDAVQLFKEITKRGGSKLIFNAEQKNAYDKEVGKAMNALGYDAILKHNGDNTGEDFYVILNRGALVAKEKYITKLL